MSLATEIDSTSNYISNTKQQTKSQHKKIETDSSIATTATGIKHSLATAHDSGLSSARTENLITKQSLASNILKAKKLPLKITQDDNRLTINLEATGAKQEPKQDEQVTTTKTTSSSSLARHIRPANFKSYRSKSDQAKQLKTTRDRSQNNENLIRIIKENIEPLNQLQPCDLFLIPLLQLSDYGTDYLKQNNDLLLANMVKSSSVSKNRTSTLITTTTTTTQQTTTEELSIQADLQHSTSFLTEFANMFNHTKNKMVNSKKENKKTTGVAASGGTRNLKELIGEAGDLSHLFMPIVQLAEIDIDRKKTNRLMNTFKHVTESYRRNRKLSKEPMPLPKQSDLIIDKSKSLINLNQVLNQSSNSSATSNGVPTAPVTAPTKKKLNNFLKTTTNKNALVAGPNAPDPPPRTHSIPGYSTARLTNDENDKNNKENNNNNIKDFDNNNKKQNALLATRLTFSTATTNTSMDLNNSDVYCNNNKFSNQSWALNINEKSQQQQQQQQTQASNQQLVLHQDQSGKQINTSATFKTLNNLNDINTSIGDIIRLLKSSSSSGSGSTHSNKLDALKHEIDKTMNEISTFKNEVSTRMKNNNTNLYNLDSASLTGNETFSNHLNNTNNYNQLSKYEKDILSILSRQQLKFQQIDDSRLITMDTAVNTDISMSNAVFTIRYDDEEEQEEDIDEDDDDEIHNNAMLNSKQISVSSQTPRSSPIIIEHDDDDHYLITNNSFINMDLMTQLRQQSTNTNNSSSLFKTIKIEEQQNDYDDKTDDSIIKHSKNRKKNKHSILDDQYDDDDINEKIRMIKKENKARRALTPLPIVESPTETYTTSNKSTYYYGNEKNKSNKYNFKVNSHTMMSNSNKSESSNVPALSLLHRDYTTNAHSSPPTYESNQSIANIDSTATTTTTNTPNTTSGTTSSNTQQQHDENLKRLKIRIKNRQQNNKTQSNSNRHHFRRFKSDSAHDNDDLYEEYNNRVNKNDDDLLIGDEDDDLEDDDDDDDSANLANNDTTANTTTTTNTSNSSSKKNPNSHVFKKIFTRAHYTQFGDPNDYYQDADDYYGNHSANIRIEPISLVNIKSNTNNSNSKRATNFVNIEHVSTSTSSSTTGYANDQNIKQKQQIKIPIKIINSSTKQQPLIKSPIINFANQKQQKKETQKQPVIDYTTFDSLADTTANVSVSSRSRCTVINSKPTKQQHQSPEQPQVKLKIIPLKRSNTSDLLSNNNPTPININSNSKRSNQYYPQQPQYHSIHCNTCSCCQCPARKQQCYGNNAQQAPLVMNIKDGRFSSVNKSSKFKFHHSETGSDEHQNLTKSSTANQLPINKYNHTTYHYKTNYNSSTTPSNNSSTATNKKERKATEQITKNKQHQQQQQRYLDEQGRLFNKNFIFNSNTTTATNKHNQHIDELSLLENLDIELDREIAKTIKSKSGKKSTNIKMSKCNIDSDCMDYSKLMNSEEDLLATEIGLTLNSLRRPHSAFQIDSYPVLNDDMLDMEDDDDEDEDDDESGTGIAVAEDEQESTSDSNMSHFKVNYNTSNYTPTYDLPKSVINKQNQYQRKNKETEHYYDSQNYNYQPKPVNQGYTKSQQQFINKFPIHITKQKHEAYEYEDNQRNYYRNQVLASKNSTQSVNLANIKLNKQSSQQPASKSSKKETQKYFIHYPIGSSSNLTNTNTSSTNNETMSFFDFSVRDLAKSPFQLQHESYNENNLNNDLMTGSNDNAEINHFESTVMLNAYKLPKKKLNHMI